MTTIRELRDAHRGETAYIVGRGPSLRDVRAESFGPGPVIALNYALLAVRALGLTNPVYSLQKDGCTPVYWAGDFIWQHDKRTCSGPPCVSGVQMVEPVPPEVLIVSTVGSAECFRDYPLRYVFDPQTDLGVPWHLMTAAMAVRVADLFGCTSLVMIAHDAYTNGDTRRVEIDGSLVDDPNAGYYAAGVAADEIAALGRILVEWRRA